MSISVYFPDGYINGKSYIEYSCKFGHLNKCMVSGFMKRQSCKDCSFDQMGLNRRGSKSASWMGGNNSLTKYIHKFLGDWKRKSMEASGFRCVISGDRKIDVHHTYPLNRIIKDAFSNLGIEYHKLVGDFSDDILKMVMDEIIRLHEFYIGVAINRQWHTLYHEIYGKDNNTLEEFMEFQSRIASGEIILN